MSKVSKKKRGRKSNKIVTQSKIIDDDNELLENDDSSDEQIEKRKHIFLNIKNINNVSKNQETELNDIFCEDKITEGKCKDCNKYIKMLSKKQAIIDNYEKKITNHVSKIYSGNLTFISIDNNKEINLKTTNVHCFWDTCKFNTLPCVLPEKYENGIYYVSRCFCGFSCMRSYNLKRIKDSKSQERDTLIFKMYRDYYNISYDEDVNIPLAPEIDVLDIYGGYKSIEKFRNDLTIHNVKYLVTYPPLKPNLPSFGEYHINSY